MKQLVFILLSSFFTCLLILWLIHSNNKVEVVNVTVNRFDKYLFELFEQNKIEDISCLDIKFGSFNEVFVTQIMQIANEYNVQQCDKVIDKLYDFTQNNDMQEAYDSTSLLFSNFSDFSADISSAFTLCNNYFPDYPTPKIITFFGGFNYGVVSYDDNIAIGLENFLGFNSKFYKYLGDPEYIRYQKQKRFIISNVMEVWFNEYFLKYLDGRDLLSQMIYKGKMVYFLDVMLPDLSLSNKLRYSEEEMDWVIQNEGAIWEYFINEDLLYSSRENKIRSYLNYAPFSKGMPEDAPARVAYYIGYKIVKDYMQNNEISIEDLIYLDNSRAFLQKSKYKPKK